MDSMAIVGTRLESEESNSQLSRQTIQIQDLMQDGGKELLSWGGCQKKGGVGLVRRDLALIRFRAENQVGGERAERLDKKEGKPC